LGKALRQSFHVILMEQLLTYDRQLFRIINSKWSNAFFDWLMPWLRNSNVWLPLYLFLLLFGLINYKKTGWWWVIFGACTVILTDFISSKLIKELIIRTRPCNDPSLADYIHVLVGYRPQSSSFVSSHAANHFGMAMYFYSTLRKTVGQWSLLFFFWAFSIAFAQVYVGVHFPLDVTCGALIGILIGYLSGKSFNRNYGLL
jgi:membrane-associated phospholipid phosphatase